MTFVKLKPKLDKAVPNVLATNSLNIKEIFELKKNAINLYTYVKA